MRISHFFFAVVLVLFAQDALAWGSNGHATAGAIADAILAAEGKNAQAHVRRILGKIGRHQVNLADAANWADCAREYEMRDGKVSYVRSRFHENACDVFDNNQASRDELAAYVANNYTQCPYKNQMAECHKSYHFADIPIEENNYRPTYFGARQWDVVHAIDAAASWLKGQRPAPLPFVITTDKEALFMIAHFVGDIHQPLHVTALYLDDSGATVDARQPANQKEQADTHGGNSLELGSRNLHGIWDATNFTAGQLALLVDEAAGYRQTGGDVTTWADAWASDTIKEGKPALLGFKVQAKSGDAWPIKYDDANAYNAAKSRLQKEQIEKAGRRMADLLMAIWPN